jgi:hypothetical protein
MNIHQMVRTTYGLLGLVALVALGIGGYFAYQAFSGFWKKSAEVTQDTGNFLKLPKIRGTSYPESQPSTVQSSVGPARWGQTARDTPPPWLRKEELHAARVAAPRQSRIS